MTQTRIWAEKMYLYKALGQMFRLDKLDQQGGMRHVQGQRHMVFHIRRTEERPR